MKSAASIDAVVSDWTDDSTGADRGDPVVDDVPTVSCSTCGREWALEYELDELRVGNRAAEQFALDHMRHTGHFPDDVATWRADCRHCPEVEERLAERAVRRWARTHARHTGHAVTIRGGDEDPETIAWERDADADRPSE